MLVVNHTQVAMGLCKCPKRKVTNLFCFEHRVNVCEHCLVSNHNKVSAYNAGPVYIIKGFDLEPHYKKQLGTYLMWPYIYSHVERERALMLSNVIVGC